MASHPVRGVDHNSSQGLIPHTRPSYPQTGILEADAELAFVLSNEACGLTVHSHRDGIPSTSQPIYERNPNAAKEC